MAPILEVNPPYLAGDEPQNACLGAERMLRSGDVEEMGSRRTDGRRATAQSRCKPYDAMARAAGVMVVLVFLVLAGTVLQPSSSSAVAVGSEGESGCCAPVPLV